MRARSRLFVAVIILVATRTTHQEPNARHRRATSGRRIVVSAAGEISARVPSARWPSSARALPPDRLPCCKATPTFTSNWCVDTWLTGIHRHSTPGSRTKPLDHEPLTDLLTVFFGLGIFSANAAFELSQRPGGWSAGRLGYLTEPMFGYALAFYTWLRGDPDPDWSRYLDTNPRSYMKKGLRYLSKR